MSWPYVFVSEPKLHTQSSGEPISSDIVLRDSGQDFFDPSCEAPREGFQSVRYRLLCLCPGIELSMDFVDPWSFVSAEKETIRCFQ